MSWEYSHLMDQFSGHDAGKLLLDGRWGLEKESLRVSSTGRLSDTPHPAVFGDKISNPHITVDFSESQVELITPAFHSMEETHDFLNRLQSFVEASIGEELLWPLSMPGSLPHDDLIPMADYGGVEKGIEKEIYRSGLALRYGKKMQMISGIHYNFSFSDGFWDFLGEKTGGTGDRRLFRDGGYLNLAKNFLRYRWLLIYLFGASPMGTEAYMSAFLRKNECVCHKACCRGTFENPVKYATSLRMSRFGYENSFQNRLHVSYNSLDDYVGELRRALNRKIDTYTDLGVYRDGRQVQLNDNLLQSENEYYAPVRLKQIVKDGGTMLDTLEEKGIEYLEFRIFDLDPFQRTGISLEQMHFIHVFMLYCCFHWSGDLTKEDMNRFNDNAQLTALFGRSSRLKLKRGDNGQISIQDWSAEIFQELMEIAEVLDRYSGSRKFQNSVKEQQCKLGNIDYLPSSAMVNLMKCHGDSHESFGIERAVHHQGKGLQRKVEAC